MKNLGRQFGAIALAVVAGQVTAEDSNTGSPALETVSVTASRIARDHADLGLSLSIIPGEEIEEVSHTHISELLSRVPGVWISRGNGQEHLTAIRSGVLTGAGSCGAFYMAEDGIPLRAPGFCNVNQLFDANTEQAGRIEVIRGAGTAVHGSNALNGVVNVISAAPSEQAETRIAAEAGANDYSRLKLTTSNTLGAHGFRISAHGEHDGGYKDDSGYDQQKLSLRHDYAGSVWTVQSLLSGAHLEQETAGYVLGEDAYKDSTRKRENPNPEAYRNSDSVRAYSRFSRDGTQDSHFVVTPYLRYTDMAFLQHFLRGTPTEENGERSVGVQSAFYQQNSDALTLHNGFDMELTQAYLKETQSNPDLGVFPTGKHYDYEVDAKYFAWFVGADYQINRKTSFSFGARYDIQFYDYDNRMISGNTRDDGTPCTTGTPATATPCRYARPEDGSARFRNWSFQTGLQRQMNEHHALNLKLAHGFRAPQASELYRLQSQQLSSDVEEEAMNSAELGLVGEWRRFSYDAALYWLHKDDVIIQDSQRRYINGSQTISRGAELAIVWSLHEKLLWRMQGSYAKHQFGNDAVSNEGNELDTAPRLLAATQLEWRPFSATKLVLEASHQDEYYLEASNSFTYPGHTLVNLRWHQDYGDQVYSVVRVHNAADIDYADRADYAFGNYRYFIGTPRSILVELGVKF
ncbi:MAG: TonB-dependent receptor [Spongiibacter sp.]|nr:TonB-dependent receptor [Spongiibacter sp.]